MVDLIIPYKPREAFAPYHASKKRFCVTVAHRRAGKTVARLNKLVRCAVESNNLNPRYGYIAPYWVQAKEIAWAYLKHYTAPLAPLGVKYHEADLSITLGHNNAQIRLYGAENAERMRGLYFDGIAPDEAQGISAATLRTIILPCLADRQGWLDISGTPKGWENLLGEVVQIARDNPDEWFLQILKASDTGILPASELALQKKLMSDNEYAQEYECDFDAAITGAVYGKQIAEMEAAGRVRGKLYDDSLNVHTAWDLGYDDSTAIWFWQKAGNEVRLIDCYEASVEDIDHYAQVLKSKTYRYGDHFVPHDAANKLLAAGGRSIVQQLHAVGIKTRVVPATSQQNQIEALRLVMRNMWIDSETCKTGLGALKQYQFEWDKEKQTFRSKPRHDWASHFADACEIIGQVLKKDIEVKSPPKPRFLEEMTFNELFSTESSRNSSDGRV